MKNTHLHSLRLLALIGSCFMTLSACATTPASKADHFAMRDANAFDPATIDAVGDKVAEWQIANLNNLSDYMRNYRNNIADRRGWHHGALYVGMMDWAALPGNEQFYAPLRKLQKRRSGGWVNACFMVMTISSGRCT